MLLALEGGNEFSSLRDGTHVRVRQPWENLLRNFRSGPTELGLKISRAHVPPLARRVISKQVQRFGGQNRCGLVYIPISRDMATG